MTLSAAQRRRLARAAVTPPLVGARVGGRLVVSGVRLGIRQTQSFPPLPDLPAGHVLDLPGGSTFVVDTGAPFPGAPTLLLLHGLATTAYLNWFGVLDQLRGSHRVITLDQRWHGRGIVSERFSLEDCADDTVAVLDALGASRTLVAGYSMGGALAQVLVGRHPDRVAGLVLCSTAMYWRATLGDRVFYPVLDAATDRWAEHIRGRVSAHAGELSPTPRRRRDLSEFAWSEFRATSAWALPEVLGALGSFDSRSWMAAVDVPTSVVVTARDHAIPSSRQREMAALIPGAIAHEAPGGHASIVFDAERWRPIFLSAVAEVTEAASTRL